jgi:hypothetical protein
LLKSSSCDPSSSLNSISQAAQAEHVAAFEEGSSVTKLLFTVLLGCEDDGDNTQAVTIVQASPGKLVLKFLSLVGNDFDDDDLSSSVRLWWTPNSTKCGNKERGGRWFNCLLPCESMNRLKTRC